MLLERDKTLITLGSLVDEARAGRGRVALIMGEAGIGKTSVVKRFAADLDEAHVLWGGCDDLMAARPLGPLWDMSFDEPDLEEALVSGERQTPFRTILELLSRALRPTVMVFEDVHWADEATLDLIRFVGRRIERTHGVLILTYRDGEVAGNDPLRVTLGDLSHDVVERIPLAPLSEEGVSELAGEGVDARALWEVTGGNPFFVSEALASARDDVPLSIRDAVNARVQRLSDDARDLVELTSVSPSRIELVLVNDVLKDVTAAIAECEEAGILEVAGGALRFRHELARKAVEGDLPVIERRRLNRACLASCERLGFDLSLCAHHAREAEDAEAIVRILPTAARRASELESHNEAVTTLRALEPYLDRMTPEQLADHYDHWSYEEYLASSQRLDLAEKATAIRRDLDDSTALANSLLIASRIAWVGADRGLAVEYAEEAASVLGEVGGEDQAMPYSVLSQLAMVGGFRDEALSWGEKALELAGEDDSRVRAHALNNIGSVKMMHDPEDGVKDLIESRNVAARLGLVHEETRACANLAWFYLLAHQLDEAEKWIDAAAAAVGDSEMPSMESYIRAEKAWWHEMRGEWNEAETIGSNVERTSSFLPALMVVGPILARVSGRRGPAQVEADLSEAIELAERSGEGHRLGPAYAVLAEYSWLGFEVSGRQLARAREVMEWCLEHGAVAPASDIGQWLVLGGHLDQLPQSALEPHLFLCEGEWAQAASWWEDRGLPYEQAVALSHGDVDAQLEALGILDDLGAGPLATRVRNQLQDAGVKGVPRGPQKATQENPLGLTARQTEVLELLTEGLTNSEIADQLFISTRTVDHHVSAILANLGVSDRHEAAEKVRELA